MVSYLKISRVHSFLVENTMEFLFRGIGKFVFCWTKKIYLTLNQLQKLEHKTELKRVANTKNL